MIGRTIAIIVPVVLPFAWQDYRQTDRDNRFAAWTTTVVSSCFTDSHRRLEEIRGTIAEIEEIADHAQNERHRDS